MTRERVSVEMPHHLIAELEDAAEERDATRNQVAVHWLGRWLDGRP
jgi:metal-responsive CopG/Arc/MetJ family transcriptional regulator